MIPATDFLNDFASDRSHMRNEDQSWIKPPPEYPSIKSQICSNNLNLYINMNCDISKSEILNYPQFSQKFSRTINSD